MLSSVTIYHQITKIVMNSGSLSHTAIPTSCFIIMTSDLWSPLSSMLTFRQVIGSGPRQGCNKLVPALSSWLQMMNKGWRDSCWRPSPPPSLWPGLWPRPSLPFQTGHWLAQPLPTQACWNPQQGHNACKYMLELFEGVIIKDSPESHLFNWCHQPLSNLSTSGRRSKWWRKCWILKTEVPVWTDHVH